MSIASITGSSGIGTLGSGGLLTGQSSAGGVSSFGPAFILGGSTTDYMQGLYSLASNQLLSNAPTAQSGGQPTDAEEERSAALQTAAAMIDGGNPKGSRAILDKLIEKNGNDITAIRLTARAFIAEQDYKQAERFYARAAALAPDEADLQSDLSMARSLQKSDANAVADARQKLKSPSYRTEALKVLFHVTNRSPQNVDAYLAMADGFDDARKPSQVLGSLQEAVKYAEGDEVDEVLTRARKLVKEHPTVGLTHNLLGRALQKKGKHNEALAEFKQAADIAPSNLGYTNDLASGYVARAQSSLDAGSMQSAQSDLRVAQVLNPTTAGIGEVRARVGAHEAKRDISRGMYTKAIKDLNAAYRDAPNDASFKRNLSGLYSAVGSYYAAHDGDSQALSSFTRAWELDPNNVAAKRQVGVLSHERGTNALNRYDYDIAIDHLNRAYMTDKTNATYRASLAEAYNQRGMDYLGDDKLHEAIADLKAGFALDPTNTTLEANLTTAIQQSLS